MIVKVLVLASPQILERTDFCIDPNLLVSKPITHDVDALNSTVGLVRGTVHRVGIRLCYEGRGGLNS